MCSRLIIQAEKRSLKNDRDSHITMHVHITIRAIID
jgi:hypothetical protein